jgi:hypothetical protein
MPFLSDLWGKILGVGAAILAGFLAFIYIRRRHIEQGRKEELQRYMSSSYDALKAANEADREFKGKLGNEKITGGIEFLNSDDGVWESDSPSSGDK